MKLRKLLLLLVFCALAQAVLAQFTQPYGYRDNGFYGTANFGSGRIKLTSPSAYLEVGDSLYSRKGLLFPRGKKDSVSNPARGLVIYDVLTNSLQLFNGTAWVPVGSGGGSASGSGTGGRLALWSSGSALTTSNIYDNGTNIGIGIAPHQVYKLFVHGSGYFNGDIASAHAVHSGPDYKVMADANGIFRYRPDTAGSGAAPLLLTEFFPGTSTNQFTVTSTPLASSITVFVNGQKVPKSYYTLTVNTIAINGGLLTFSTDTNDKIEITYQPL